MGVYAAIHPFHMFPHRTVEAEAEEEEEGHRNTGPERFFRRLGGPVILLTTEVELRNRAHAAQRAEDKAPLWGPVPPAKICCAAVQKERKGKEK